ncbi:amidohydrolase family protein [Streptomyces sp. SID6673]|nr:amidohydrolase family protein [Streptomyces sp. SID11726]NEB27110.1 amidohydrolase family protein [Streptomyces sp. SID6673]
MFARATPLSGPRSNGIGSPMLIRNADTLDGEVVDLRCDDGLISEIGSHLRPRAGEHDIDAAGCWVMPGLHDHHLHLRSLAATAGSLRVGPPDVHSDDDLRAVLHAADLTSTPGEWLRAFGYHESVAGTLTRDVLDTTVTDRPVRVQHRSGALWMLNSAACRELGVDTCTLPGVERDAASNATGRLWRMDSWLGDRLGDTSPASPPDLATMSRRAAARGVTGFTEATPDLSQSSIDALAAAVHDGEIVQRVHCMSTPGIRPPADRTPGRRTAFTLGPTKILLDDDRLPTLPELTETISGIHCSGKPVAVHCVTRLQLIVTMTALDDAGVVPGDRIEHGAIIPAECFGWLCDHRIPVITQPNFPFERSEQYRIEVDAGEQADLWRLGSLLAAGIHVAAGTDAPFGDSDPWTAIHAATIDHSGRDPRETVTPATALGLFWGTAEQPTSARVIERGAIADLTVVRGAPEDVRHAPASVEVVATVVGGVPVHLS